MNVCECVFVSVCVCVWVNFLTMPVFKSVVSVRVYVKNSGQEYVILVTKKYI